MKIKNYVCWLFFVIGLALIAWWALFLFSFIWVNKKNSLMPDAEFKWNRFYKEIAVGAGFGARFEFSFFILRVDMAIPV